MSTRLDNAITEYWWNHQSLQEELSRLTNLSAAITTTQASSSNEGDNVNREESNTAELIELTKLELNEAVCDMVRRHFVDELNELDTEEHDSETHLLQKNTPSRNINNYNTTMLTEKVNKLAAHLLEIKQRQRDEARQFAQWASITTTTTTNNTNEVKKNSCSCNEKTECWDDDMMSCYVEAFALCFEFIIKAVNNVCNENETDDGNNNDLSSNESLLNEKWSLSHVMWCDNLLKDMFIVSTRNKLNKMNMKEAIVFGLLHLFYVTLQITPAEITAHFPLVQEAVRNEWQIYVSDVCLKWNTHDKKETSDNDNSNKANVNVNGNKVAECMNECAELLSSMRLALMFFVSEDYNKKKIILKHVSTTAINHNYSNFYYSIKKKLAINTMAHDDNNVVNSNSNIQTTEHASFCVLLPLISYKDGVWCVNILRSLLTSCKKLFKLSLPMCAENKTAWDNLRKAAHEFVIVFSTHPNLSINMLEYIDLLASIFWSEDGNKSHKPESNVTEQTGFTTGNLDMMKNSDEIAKMISKEKYKTYKSCLTYMYEMEGNANSSVNNINSSKSAHVKHTSTSATKENSQLYLRTMMTAISVSNTFVAHALRQYAETNCLCTINDTTKKVATITSNNTNTNNQSVNMKNTPKEVLDKEFITMLSYTLLHSPIETLYTIFDLLIPDETIRRMCSFDKLVSEKEDFVRRSAAYNEKDCTFPNSTSSSSSFQDETQHDNEDVSSDAQLAQIIFTPRFYSFFTLVEKSAQYINNQLNELSCADTNDKNDTQSMKKHENNEQEMESAESIQEQEEERCELVVANEEHNNSSSSRKNTEKSNSAMLTLYLAAILDVAIERYLTCVDCTRSNTVRTDNNSNSTSTTASIKTKINQNEKCHDLTQITAMSEILMFFALLSRSKLILSTNTMPEATSSNTYSSSSSSTITTTSTIIDVQHCKNELLFIKSALQLFFTPMPTMLHYLHKFIVQHHQCYGLMAFFLPLLRALGLEYSTAVEFAEMGLAVQYPACAEVSYLFELPRCFFAHSECRVALNMHQDALNFVENLLSLDKSDKIPNNDLENEEEEQELLERNNNKDSSSISNKNEVCGSNYNLLDKVQNSSQGLFIDLMVEAGKVAISRLQSVPFASASNEDLVGQWVEQSLLSRDNGCTVDVVTSFWYGMLRLLRNVNYWNDGTRANVLKKIKQELFRALPAAKSLTPVVYLLTLPQRCNSSESPQTNNANNISVTTNNKSSSSNTNVNINTVQPTHSNTNVSVNIQKSLMSHWVEWFWSVNYDDVDEHPMLCAKALLRSCNLQYIKSIPTKTLLTRRSTLEQHNTQIRSSEKHILACMERAIQEDVEELIASQKVEIVPEKEPVNTHRETQTETHVANVISTHTNLVNLSAPQMSDYTHRILTTLLQRSRMSTVDSALCGVAARLFIVSCASNNNKMKYISHEELIKFLKRLVYLISVRIPFATPQECLSFAMCLRVMTDSIFVPYLHLFVVNTSTSSNTNTLPNSSSVTRSGSVSQALASSSSSSILQTAKANKNDETECLVQALGNNALTAVELIQGVIHDCYESITSCLRLNSQRGDWNAYYMTLHTGGLIKLTKKYDDQYKREVEARRQILVRAKPLSDTNNNIEKKEECSGVESSAGFVKLAHLDRPLLFHLTNPTSSLFELCGVKEIENKIQMSNDRENALPQHHHYHHNQSNYNNRLQSHSSLPHSSTSSLLPTTTISSTSRHVHSGSTHRTLHTSRDGSFTNRQMTDDIKSGNNSHSHSSSHIKHSTSEESHSHQSERDHRHYHNHNNRDHYNNINNNRSSTTQNERNNEIKTSSNTNIHSKEISHSDKIIHKRDRSLHRSETSNSHHFSLYSDNNNNKNNKKDDNDDEHRRRRYKQDEQKKVQSVKPESSRSHHHEFNRHDRDKNEINNESKRLDRHESRNERHDSDYKHSTDSNVNNDRSKRHYDEAYSREHRYHGSGGGRRDADYDRHYDNRNNRHRREKH